MRRRAVGRAGPAAAVCLALLAAACGRGGVPDAEEPLGQFFRGTAAEPTTIDPEQFRPIGPCPRVALLPETESLRITRGGDEFEEGTLVYQARIDDTARECSADGDVTRVRVGVAGRALSGPDEIPGTVRLPIRIVVREGGEVVYSKLHRVEVTLTEETPSAPFAFVDEEVRVSDREGARILVGFDERGR